MTSPDQLITRYTKFIQYATSDDHVLNLLKEKKGFFEMKNYLLLAVDLVYNKHLAPGKKYMQIAMSRSPKVFFERGFYAFIKHYLRHSLS